MPEGDTLFKIAAYLRPALCGQILADALIAAIPGAEFRGCRVEEVFARGKHLFITFADGRTLRSHLGMWGSWHTYAHQEPWQRPRQRAGIVLATSERLFVCFNPKEVEVLHPQGVRQRELSQSIGPDLLDPGIDLTSLPARAAKLADLETPLIDILLDQRIASGIGNVYKSETLYLVGRHPLTVLGALTERELVALYQRGSELLASNTGGGPRTTRHANDQAGILWVYGRTAKACHRCGTPIRAARLGRHHRSTFWCPFCQPEL